MLVKISEKNQTKLVRAMEVTDFLCNYLFENYSNGKPTPWLPEILSYLHEDLSSVHDEIDKSS